MTAGAIVLGIVAVAGVVGVLGVATVAPADAGGTADGVAGVGTAQAAGEATVATGVGVDPRSAGRPASDLPGARAARAGAAGVAGAGPAARAHGSFNVILLTQRSTAVVGRPEPYRLNFSTGGRDLIPHPDPGTPVRVEYTVLVDGRPVRNGSVEMGYLAARDVDFEYTFEEPGPHDLSVNATFTVPNANWSRDSRSLRAIDVRAGDRQGDGTGGGSDGGSLPLSGFESAAALVALLVGLAVLARSRSDP